MNGSLAGGSCRPEPETGLENLDDSQGLGVGAGAFLHRRPPDHFRLAAQEDVGFLGLQGKAHLIGQVAVGQQFLDVIAGTGLFPGDQGEILVQGTNVFRRYWNKPEATQDSFIGNNWFRTGDIAIYNSGSYKIIGRSSVDIIKTGGYKIAALEIEEILRTYRGVKDCGVVGIPDEEWGEIVCAALIPLEGTQLDFEDIKTWIKEKLPAYKTPRRYLIMEDLPRNAMGKVTKNKLKSLF